MANCPNWSPAKSGSIATTSDGQVIQNLDITGNIQVRHNNVTIRCVRVNANGSTRAITDGGRSFQNLLVENSELFGTSGGGTNQGNGKCIYSAGSGYTLRRVNLHSCGDAIHVSGSGPVVVEDSYCHDLKTGNSEHNDCFQMVAGSRVVLRHNTFIAPFHQNSAVNITSNFAQVNDVLVENNRLGGGGYVVYVLDQWQSGSNNCPTNTRFLNNVFVPGSYQWGLYSFAAERSCGPGSSGWQWSGNKMEGGAAVGP